MKPEKHVKLGRLIVIHGIAPAFLQRTMIVAALAFVFFAATMVMFSMWRNFLYFFLSTAFLIVYLFTMFGWLMLRKNVLKIYEQGISYRKFIAKWPEIAAISESARGDRRSWTISRHDGTAVTISDTLHDVDKAAAFIRECTAPRV